MRILLFIIGLIAAGYLGYRYVPNAAQSIENDITERVTASLLPNDLPADVQIDVEGRDVKLSGAVDKPSDEEKFVGLTNDVIGVRSVQNNLTVLNVPVASNENVSSEEEAETAAPQDVVINEVQDTIESANETLAEVTTNIVAQGTAMIEAVEENGAKVTEQAASVIEEVTEAPAIDSLMPAEEIETSAETEEEVITVSDEDLKASSECQSAISALVNNKRVNFTTGQSKIKRESLPLLNDIAEEMRQCDDIALHIHGHTDNVGDEALNRRLSHARAKSVGLYLLRQGVTQRVKIFGHGDDQPIASNDTEEGRMANRRIEFAVVDENISAANDNQRTRTTTHTTRSLRNIPIIER